MKSDSTILMENIIAVSFILAQVITTIYHILSGNQIGMLFNIILYPLAFYGVHVLFSNLSSREKKVKT